MPTPVKSAFSVEGEGEPIFLIHGIGASRASFAGLVPHLKNEYRVISYDLRGHGASPKPTPPATCSPSCAAPRRPSCPGTG